MGSRPERAYRENNMKRQLKQWFINDVIHTGEGFKPRAQPEKAAGMRKEQQTSTKYLYLRSKDKELSIKKYFNMKI